MAIQTEPTRIQIPFADSGTKNVIPDTNSTPSASQAASWTDGFPAQCSLPLSAGGIPPARADFNGILNTMTQSERFTQEGGVWAWDATVDYGTNRMVLGSDGLLYWSVAQSGPNLGGAQDPTLDIAQTYWASPKVPTTPAVDSSAAAASTQWVNAWYNGKIILPEDLYVDAVNGDDANDGYTAGTAKKTFSGIYALLQSSSYVLRTNHTVYIAAGTYATVSDFSIAGTVLEFVFSSGAIINDAFIMNSSGANIVFSGSLKMTGSGRFLVNGSSWLLFGSQKFSQGLSLTFENCSVGVFFQAILGGFVGLQWAAGGLSVAFSGTNSASSAIASTSQFGYINFIGGGGAVTTWTGSVTGRRYVVNYLSAIQAGSPTAIPGTTAGTVDSLGHFN